MPKRKQAFRFEIDRHSDRPFFDQVRDQFVNMLHFGVISPGSRLPTVRQLAEDGGINLKTAFKIYRALGQAGLVEIRPQSGVFVRSGRGKAEGVYRRSVVEFLNRVESEATRLNLTTRRLIHLLSLRNGKEHGAAAPADREASFARMAPVTCAVLECNREQTRTFALELERKLGVKAEPVEAFANTPPAGLDRVLRQADFFATTDYHWEEGARLAQRYRKKILRLHLDPKFLKLILASARKGPFAMIVTDTTIQERFRQSFAPYLKPMELDRLRMVHPGDKAGIAAINHAGGRVYISPLCEKQVRPLLSPSLIVVHQENMLAAASLKELKEDLLFYPVGSK
jgi:DNA-binding transcriptional regulator YhcF (GntR family)